MWDVLQCDRCFYTWRTIEPVRRTRRDAYPEAFKLTEADTTELHLPPGSRLVLYTDGLVEDRARDFDAGLDTLRTVLEGEAARGPE